MLVINKRSFAAKTMEQLKERVFKRRENFYKNWEEFNNNNNCTFYFEQLTPNLLIQCSSVNIDDYESKQTNIYDLKTDKVICISGIATLNIKEIPTDKKYYKI